MCRIPTLCEDHFYFYYYIVIIIIIIINKSHKHKSSLKFVYSCFKGSKKNWDTGGVLI